MQPSTSLARTTKRAPAQALTTPDGAGLKFGCIFKVTQQDFM